MRKFLAAFALAIGLLSTQPAHAICNATLPFTLTPNTLADANQVMADFNAIITGLNTTCAASGINNDITALNGVAVLKPQNNLADVQNKQTSVNNLGLGCSASSPFSNTTQGAVNGVFATCFGVKADGVTDDTAAWNTVVTFLNGAAGRTVIAPFGTSNITALNPLTTGGQIVCITGRGTCSLSYSSNQALIWNGGIGGGLEGMKLVNRGAVCNTAIFIHGNAAQQTFSRLVIDSSINSLATLGTNAGSDQSGTSWWRSLYSPNGTHTGAGACPLFNLVTGFGFFLIDSTLFSNSPTTAGANLLNSNQIGPVVFGAGAKGYWDTAQFDGNLLGPYYILFNFGFTLNGEALDWTWQNNYVTAQVANWNVTGAGSFNANVIQNNWIDGNGTATFAGLFVSNVTTGLQILNNRVFGYAGSGFQVGAGTSGIQVTQIQIRNNNLNALGCCGFVGTSYGILISGDGTSANFYNDIHITGNIIGSLLEPHESGVPTFGILMQNFGGTLSNTLINDNSPLGLVPSQNIVTPATGTLTNVKVLNNANMPTITQNLAIGASPFNHTAGPRPETIYIYGSTALVTVIDQNSPGGAGQAVCQGNFQGTWGTQSMCTVVLPPLDTVQINYNLPIGNLTAIQSIQ